jgi:hypothetical protein
MFVFGSSIFDYVVITKIDLKNILKILNESNMANKYINVTEIESLKREIELLKKEIEYLKGKPLNGSQCLVNGHNYEKKIHNITKNSYIMDKPFNTQKEEELGRSSSKNDIECNFDEEKDIGIEAKKYNTPDWMQCSIKYNTETKSWEASKKGKNLLKCREIFNNIINNINLYDGKIPPFMENPITHEEWVKIKSETNKWNDNYIDIPSDTIARLYQAKGCKYIQISNGYGLYHLGNDICNFDVPLFNIEQQLRIRTKVHTKKNTKGFCSLSVTIACQPKDIKKIIQSKYSLDDENKLPLLLNYNIKLQ